jgi:hypothetical protein
VHRAYLNTLVYSLRFQQLLQLVEGLGQTLSAQQLGDHGATGEKPIKTAFSVSLFSSQGNSVKARSTVARSSPPA